VAVDHAARLVDVMTPAIRPSPSSKGGAHRLSRRAGHCRLLASCDEVAARWPRAATRRASRSDLRQNNVEHVFHFGASSVLPFALSALS